VFDIIQPFQGVAEERLRNHNFIIPRPKQKNKREMPEMQGKKPQHVLPAQSLTSCPEPVGMSLRDDQLQEFRIEA
jgi:hypothetical protein